MPASILPQAAVTMQSSQQLNDLGFCPGFQVFSMRMISHVSKIGGMRTRSCCVYERRKLVVAQASMYASSTLDPVLPSSNNNSDESKKKSNVPLTKKGVEEAIEAGKRISNIPVDTIYTSSLIRAQMTAMLAMTQHRRRKVPIIMHTESEQAKAWSQIYSEDTKKLSIPVIPAWQLNERMYGELQGLNKEETEERFGKEKVHEWRRSYDIPPPSGECLKMCSQRAVAYFKDHIEPQLASGKNIMIAAHANSLRCIIMYLDKLTSQEVINLELPTGIPMLYIFREGNFIRRGSPVGPTEAGVYAYTRHLAQYRQKLDDLLH